MEKKGNHTAAKASTASILSVAMVLFASHAGGGFATGNQENTYFVCSGWAGLLSLALSMAILTGIIAIAMRLYNKYDLHSYKELFKKLYHPFDKLELVFELFFYVMVIMAVSVAIAGAASALGQYFGWNYYVCIVLVGLLVFFATIFGERAVQLISTYMGTAIMICIFVAYGYGILKAGNVGHLFSVRFQNEGFSELPKAIWNAFVYAGFQCVQIPTMLACGAIFKGKNNNAEGKSMFASFFMNTFGLGMAVFMLLCWENTFTKTPNGSTLPTLTVLQTMKVNWLLVVYGVILLLCLVSSAITLTFAFVDRFENSKVVDKVPTLFEKRCVLSAFIIILSVVISLGGLTNIIKYGYGYMGYLAIFLIIIPLLTVGRGPQDSQRLRFNLNAGLFCSCRFMQKSSEGTSCLMRFRCFFCFN